MFATEKKTHNKELGEKVPAYDLFLLAGTSCKTPGHDHTVINT